MGWNLLPAVSDCAQHQAGNAGINCCAVVTPVAEQQRSELNKVCPHKGRWKQLQTVWYGHTADSKNEKFDAVHEQR